MTRAVAIAAGAAVFTLVIGAAVAIYLGQSARMAADDPFAQCRSSAIAGGQDVIGGPFTLVSETGETVTDRDVITEPSLLYFGYTFCPDICPLDTVRNAEAVDILDAQGTRVQPVFISVDPGRDTPEVVAAFTANIHPRMLGLTGSPEQTDAAADAYRVYYRINQEGEDPYYLVDHTGFTYLVLPDYGFVEFFNRDIGPVEMAERTQCFVDAAAEAGPPPMN